MWIAGLDALRKPLLHLHTQANVDLPWADDRHGLHEPQPGRARRPGVRLHPDPARRRPQDRRRARRATRRWPTRIGAWVRAAAGLAALRSRCGWPGSATTCATSRSPRATRSRPSCAFGVSVNTYGVNDLVAAVDAVDRRGRSTRWSREYEDSYDVVPELRGGRRAARVAALRAPASRLGLRGFLDRRRVPRVHHELRGPRRAAAAARAGRAAADGRRLRLRRRGRLEDRRCWCARSRSMAAGLPGGTSFMEDYTYHLGPGDELILGAHMLEVCPSIAGGQPRAARSTRWASAAARTRSGWSSTPRPGPAVVVGLADLGDRFRLVANEIDVVAPRRAAAAAAGRPGGLATRARPAPPPPRRWLTAGGPHHTVLSHRGRACERADGPRRDGPHRAGAHRRRHHAPSASPTSCAGTRRTTGWPRASDAAVTRAGARCPRSRCRVG